MSDETFYSVIIYHIISIIINSFKMKITITFIKSKQFYLILNLRSTEPVRT